MRHRVYWLGSRKMRAVWGSVRHIWVDANHTSVHHSSSFQFLLSESQTCLLLSPVHKSRGCHRLHGNNLTQLVFQPFSQPPVTCLPTHAQATDRQTQLMMLLGRETRAKEQEISGTWYLREVYIKKKWFLFSITGVVVGIMQSFSFLKGYDTHTHTHILREVILE